MADNRRMFYQGSVEYIGVRVEVTGTVLDTQVFEISFDREVWHEAEWTGDVGSTRVARLLLNSGNTPTTTSPVYGRLTSGAETIIERAGTLVLK